MADVIDALSFETTGPELTKRPFLSHKRTKEERAWPLFQRNQAFKGHGITKGELALGDPCKRDRANRIALIFFSSSTAPFYLCPLICQIRAFR
jgi:hypothetical protein